MDDATWQTLSPVHLACEKQPARGRRGMVVTNHPLASAAGAGCWRRAATRWTRRWGRCWR